MGRIKQYSKKQKKRHPKKLLKKSEKEAMDVQDDHAQHEDPAKHSSDALSVGKKKQIFKKEKSKPIKAKIAELKLQSKKLNKKNLA